MPQLLLQLLPALPALMLAQQQLLLVLLQQLLILPLLLLLLLLLLVLLLLLQLLLAAAVRPSCHRNGTHYRHSSNHDTWLFSTRQLTAGQAQHERCECTW
jgi:hypothetical protein